MKLKIGRSRACRGDGWPFLGQIRRRTAFGAIASECAEDGKRFGHHAWHDGRVDGWWEVDCGRDVMMGLLPIAIVVVMVVMWMGCCDDG